MDNIIINEDYLNNIISSIYKNIGLTNKEEFLNYLKVQNIDIEEIEKISKEAIWNQLILKNIKKSKNWRKKIKKEIENNKQFANSYLLYEIVLTRKKRWVSNNIWKN